MKTEGWLKLNNTYWKATYDWIILSVFFFLGGGIFYEIEMKVNTKVTHTIQISRTIVFSILLYIWRCILVSFFVGFKTSLLLCYIRCGFFWQNNYLHLLTSSFSNYFFIFLTIVLKSLSIVLNIHELFTVWH